MTLKIEEGKFYRTRDGRKVGPARPEPFGSSRYPWLCGNRAYREDGVYFSDGMESGHDIVAEWTDEPDTAPAPEAAPEPASPAKRFRVTVVWDTGDGPQKDTIPDVTAYYINDGFLRVAQADNSARMFALQHVRVYSVTGTSPE